MTKLVNLYRLSHLGNRLPAYDGRKSLYTAGPLPFASKEFLITLVDNDDGSGASRYEAFDICSVFMPICTFIVSYCFICIQEGETIQSCLQIHCSC